MIKIFPRLVIVKGISFINLLVGCLAYLFCLSIGIAVSDNRADLARQASSLSEADKRRLAKEYGIPLSEGVRTLSDIDYDLASPGRNLSQEGLRETEDESLEEYQDFLAFKRLLEGSDDGSFELKRFGVDFFDKRNLLYG